MSEEELELLITLDHPEGEPEEDTFHRQAKNTLDSGWVSGVSSTNEPKPPVS